MEAIGMLFGLFFGILLATGLGWALAKFVELDPDRSNVLAVIARCLPGLCILWMVVCAFNLPGNSYEIDQALPNGYYLEGLGKMPEYSHLTEVEDLNGSPAFPAQLADIDRIAVKGNLIFGRTTEHAVWDGGDTPPEPLAPTYFLLDSDARQVSSFATSADLDKALGAPANLVDTGDFTSQQPPSIRQHRRNRRVTFWPPIAAFLLFVVAMYLPIFSRNIDTTKSIERRNRILS